MTKPYGHIFLQWGNHADWDSITWCQDKIDDDDVEYVRRATVDDMLDVLQVIFNRVMYESPMAEMGNIFDDDMIERVRGVLAKAKDES